MNRSELTNTPQYSAGQDYFDLLGPDYTTSLQPLSPSEYLVKENSNQPPERNVACAIIDNLDEDDNFLESTDVMPLRAVDSAVSPWAHSDSGCGNDLTSTSSAVSPSVSVFSGSDGVRLRNTKEIPRVSAKRKGRRPKINKQTPEERKISNRMSAKKSRERAKSADIQQKIELEQMKTVVVHRSEFIERNETVTNEIEELTSRLESLEREQDSLKTWLGYKPESIRLFVAFVPLFVCTFVIAQYLTSEQGTPMMPHPIGVQKILDSSAEIQQPNTAGEQMQDKDDIQQSKSIEEDGENKDLFVVDKSLNGEGQDVEVMRNDTIYRLIFKIGSKA